MSAAPAGFAAGAPDGGPGLPRALPVRARVALAAVAVQVALGTLLRVGFYLGFRARAAEDPTGGELLRAFYLGFKFDLRLALLLALPFLLLSFVPALDPLPRAGGRPRRAARRLWLAWFVLVQLALLAVYAADFGHYEYLHERLNAAVMNEVLSPAIAAQMVWETYPVISGLLGLLAVAAGYAWLVRRLAMRELDRPRAPLSRAARISWAVGVTLAVAFGIYGKLSWYPLRWSDAYFGTKRFVSAIALNPALFFVDSFPTRGNDFDVTAVRAHYDEVAALLEVAPPDPETPSFARWQEPSRPAAAGEQPRNLVVIHLESWAAFKTGCMGNPLEASPYFDQLAARSVLFTDFFVAIPPTARSVFAMLSGTPDFSPVASASRNPRIVRQHNPVAALDDYAKLYFLGGSASWANIRGLLASSIDGLEIYEEGDFEGADRVDAWGVSDLALFEKAIGVLNAEPDPFFAFIQTAGNHKPYSIPDDRRGFELEELDPDVLLANGFSSLAAYNGFRFLDYALGWFFREAAREPWFERTVFLLYGDHGVPATHGIPFESLGLTNFHVPFLVFAPGLIEEGRRVDTVASLVDLLPTGMGLIGRPFLNTTFGRDLFAPRPAEAQVAYVQEGLLSNEFLLRVTPSGDSRLYRYRSEAPLEECSAAHPAERARLRRLYDGLTETGRYLLFHNPPRPHVP